MGLFCVAVSLMALHLGAGELLMSRDAGQQSPPAGARQQPRTERALPPASPDRPSDASTDLFSIDRIRQQLGRPRALRPATPDSNLPRYRVEVWGSAFRLPSWKDRIGTAPSLVPMPIGGVSYYDMTRLNTRPELFTNREGVGMMQVALESQLGMFLIRKAIEAQRRAIVQQAREEVQRELAEVLAHNARVAAGQNDPTAKSDVKKK